MSPCLGREGEIPPLRQTADGWRYNPGPGRGGGGDHDRSDSTDYMYPSRCASPTHFPMFPMAAQHRAQSNCSPSHSIPSPAPSPSLPFHPPPDEIIIPKKILPEPMRSVSTAVPDSLVVLAKILHNQGNSFAQTAFPTITRRSDSTPANERRALARFYTASLPLRRPSRSDNASIRPFFFLSSLLSC